MRYSIRLFFTLLLLSNSLTALFGSVSEEVEYALRAQETHNKAHTELLADLIIETVMRSCSKHQRTRTPLIETITERLKKNSQALTKLVNNNAYELNKAVFAGVTALLFLSAGISKLVSPQRTQELPSIMGWFGAAGISIFSYMYWFLDSKSLLSTAMSANYTRQAASLHEFALILENMKKSEQWPLLVQKLSKLK